MDLRELLDRTERLLKGNERVAAGCMDVARSAARDVLELANLIVPADQAEAEIVRGARERAQQVLRSLGGDPRSVN